MEILQNLSIIKKVIDNHISLWHENNNVDTFYLNNNDPFLQQILNILNSNYKLWHLEDIARDPVADDSVIADIKRKIDKENQLRNDKIEQFDILLNDYLSNNNIVSKTEDFNSETPGSIIDRITILSLKIYHMAEQTYRKDVSTEHVENCKSKLKILKLQRDDLLKALKNLINDILSGRKIHKVYFQFKMYNDPSLNPVIYTKDKKSENSNN